MVAADTNASLQQTSRTRGDVTEIADILSAGLMRLKSRQSTALSQDAGESSLDCAAHQSGHAGTLTSQGGGR
jgi:hypothetical protein